MSEPLSELSLGPSDLVSCPFCVLRGLPPGKFSGSRVLVLAMGASVSIVHGGWATVGSQGSRTKLAVARAVSRARDRDARMDDGSRPAGVQFNGGAAAMRPLSSAMSAGLARWALNPALNARCLSSWLL